MRKPQGRVTQSILALIRSFLAAVSHGRFQDLHPAAHSQNNLCPSVWLMLLWSFFLSFSLSYFFKIEQDVDENTCSNLLFLMNNLYKIKWHHRPITAGKRESGRAKRAVIDHSCFLICQESPNKVPGCRNHLGNKDKQHLYVSETSTNHIFSLFLCSR